VTGIEINPQFQQALDLLNAGSSVFITGKAGTGKSTLLRHYLTNSERPAVVSAPTGVAALNVGGETVHRVFGFTPTVTPEFVASREYKPNAKTRNLLGVMETLVVDEVSMVRADLLDAMDTALRRFGPVKDTPFGGVQMVFVGDPYQLPPVVSESEEQFFRTYYPTPFFFSADALRELDFSIVELQKIYRQKDDTFISLLNAVRTGDADQSVFDALNTRYQPTFEPPDDEFWVTLTTTNKMADAVNQKALDALDAELHTHEAVFTGTVEDNDKAVPEVLEFKVGAQIMMVNNDPAGDWVNGSMGVVTDTYTSGNEPVVIVELMDTEEEVAVRPHTWDITRAVVEGGKITYESIGTYRQLPFKPAWAVTIHKSQGQTLDRAIVSLGWGTFADGQLYVALSRCTSMDGLVLKSEVRAHHVKVEREVTRFLARNANHDSTNDGWAFIGAHTTGVTRHDRVIEIGVIVQRPDGDLEEFSTVVNPMRDIGRAAEDYGISATDVEMAPTFAEAWPWLARRLEGCVVVAHNLPLLQTMIEREAEASLPGVRIDLGLGVDTGHYVRDDLEDAAADMGYDLPAQPHALDLARATRLLFTSIGEAELPPVDGYRPREEARHPGRIQSRDVLAPAPFGGGALAYADAAIQAATSRLEETDAEVALQGYAREFEVPDDEVAAIHAQAMGMLLAAAHRDGVVSQTERHALLRAARILNQPTPDLPDAPTTGDIAALLVPGAGVCFTGSAVGLNGEQLERPELHAIAEAHGLIPLKSVTKKNTDLVVAADPASMSGKAKKAREFGIPVFGAQEFLQWVAQR